MKNNLGKYIQTSLVEPCRKWLYRFACQALWVLILALILNLVFSYGFTTPKMWHLGKVNNQLVEEYRLLSSKIEYMDRQLDDIIDHDRNLYNSVFSIDTLDNSLVWTIPDEEYYHGIAYGRYSELMVNTEKQFDRFAHRLYGASLSLDQAESFASSKDVMVEHIPTIWPVDRSKIKNIGAFGWRIHPILRYRRMHTGVDMSGERGTPIYATGDGMVESAEYYGGYGRQVLVNHQFGFKTRYAHLSKILVREGQWVKRGEVIGHMGNTGLSKGSHLHYEVILKGKPVNPMSYLRKDISEEEFREIIESVKPTTFEVD